MQALLEDGELRLGNRQRGVLAFAHGDLEVVIEALQLREDPPYRLGARRHLGLGQRLHRMAEGKRMGNARGSGHPLRDEDREVERDLADSSLSPAPLEEQPLRAVGDVLAAGLDEELCRLEHARADWTVRDHEHARPAEPLRTAVLRAHVFFLGELDLTPVGGVADKRLEPRMALGRDRVQIVDLALEPVRCRH